MDHTTLSHAAMTHAGTFVDALHLAGNVLTGVAYFSIPLAILCYLRKRPDMEFRWVAHLFATFILACGTGHFLMAAEPWFDNYGLIAVSHTITAAVSLVTAGVLWGLMPKLLKIPSRAKLREVLHAVQEECRRRIDAENALRANRLTLEQRVTERTAQLQASEARFRDMANSMPQIVWVANAGGDVLFLNQQWYDTTGMPFDQRRQAVDPADRERWATVWAAARLESKPLDTEVRFWNKAAGEHRWHLVRAVPVSQEDGSVLFYGTCTDIHAQRQNAEALVASLAEKETLLREVNHRVKNNLQSLWGLIQVEMMAMADPTARGRFEALANRISIMGSIHQRLYRSSNLAKINFGDQVDELVQDIVRVSQVSNTVTAEVAAEPLLCDLETAIPLGMLVNEVVTNVVKHAFPAGGTGSLRVRFGREGDSVRLVVADDGVGIAPDRIGAGVGSQLMIGLSQQIQAEMTVEPGDGTTVILTLPGSRFEDCPVCGGADAVLTAGVAAE